MNLTEFKNKIQVKNVEGNRTYLSVETNGLKYGNSYQNTVQSLEDMKNSFVVFYYPIYEQDMEVKL